MLGILLLLTGVVPCVYSLGVFAPLYYEPGRDCSGWSSISSAVSAHSGTSFYLVINPDDGPGSSGSQPEQAYNDCVPRLRPSSNPNAIVLGYIRTESKSSSSIIAEIDTYARWDSSARPTGILFDGTNPSSVNQYQSLVSHAKDKGFNFIILEPGDSASSDYYSLANLVITYESSYSGFSASKLVISSSTPTSKQAVILSRAPSTGSYSETISEIASLGVAAVYITTLSDNDSGVPSQWVSFVNDVSAAGGQSSSTSADPTTSSPPSPTQTSSTGLGTTVPSGSSAASAATSASNSNKSVQSSSHTPTLSSSSPLGFTSLSSDVTRTPNPQSSSTSPTAGATSNSTSSTPVGAIVGGVLGVIILILIFLLFFMWRRRRQLSQAQRPTVDPFLSRQPFTLIQTPEKNTFDTPSATAGSYPPTTTSPPTSASSDLTYPPSTTVGDGTSRWEKPSLPRFILGTSLSTPSGSVASGSVSPRYSIAPPPYRTPSPV